MSSRETWAAVVLVLVLALVIPLMTRSRTLTHFHAWGQRTASATDKVITDATPLLDTRGRLSAVGWSRTHLLQYTREVALDAGADHVPNAEEYATIDRGLSLEPLPPRVPTEEDLKSPSLPPHETFRHWARYPPEEGMTWGPGGPPKPWGTFMSQLPRRVRLKEWETWAVIGPKFLLVATIIDVGYSRTANIYLASTVPEDSHVEETDNAVFPLGVGLENFTLSQHPVGRGSCLASRIIRLVFDHSDFFGRYQGADTCFVDVWSRRIHHNRGLSFHVQSNVSGIESVSVASPVGRDGFLYRRTMMGIPGNGTFEIGGRDDHRRYATNTTALIHDWARGVLDYETTMLWAFGSRRSGSMQSMIGVALGIGPGVETHVNHNSVTVAGVVHKLHGNVDVTWGTCQPTAATVGDSSGHRACDELPTSPDAVARVWNFESSDGRLDHVQFAPFDVVEEYTNLLVVKSEQYVAFGRWSGKVRLDDGSWASLDGVTGYGRYVRARW